MSTTGSSVPKPAILLQYLVTGHIAGGDQEMRSAQSEPTCGVPECLSTAVFKCQNAEGFAVKRTAKYVEESLDLVQLQNAKPVVTPLTEQKSANLRDQPRAVKFNTHCSDLWLANCSTLLE